MVLPTGSPGKSAAVTTASTPFSALARDARVRVRAAQQLGVRHARQRQVGGVDRLAGDALPSVDTGETFADDFERCT